MSIRLWAVGIGGVFGSNVDPEMKPPIRCVRNLPTHALVPAPAADGTECVICLEPPVPEAAVRITTCSHVFCRGCIEPWLHEHRSCPVCKRRTVWYTWNQPHGVMRVRAEPVALGGFPNVGTLTMTFHIPAGFSRETGVAYDSLYCHAYLPDTEEGQHCVKLIRTAFRQRLLFKLEGRSVVPNSIELKTSRHGFVGDPTYFVRLREDLKKVDIS